MNILYLCDEYPPGRHGGIGTAVQLLAREMVKQGHNVVVAGFYDWGYGGANEFEDEGVKVYRFNRKLASRFFYRQDSLLVRGAYKILKDSAVFHNDIKASLAEYGVFLEKIIHEYRIDVVEMPDFCDYMRFCKSYVPFPKLSVPVIVKLHGGMTYIARSNDKSIAPYVWQMEHDLLVQANAVVSVSKYNAAKTSECLEYKENVEILYNGIDTSILPENVSKIKNRVIYTGSLTENKGVFQLIRAWNLVNEKIPDAELWLFGKGPIKKILPLLSAKAKDTVHFKGHVPRAQLFIELAQAEVAIFPSLAESFAMAPMEAMACGTAVIYTQLSSGPELIQDGVNGLLVDPHNINDICNKITMLLGDRNYNLQISKAGMSHVKNEYDISVICKRNIKFYLSIVNKFSSLFLHSVKY